MRIEDGPWHVAPSISLDGTTAIDPSFWSTHLPVSHEKELTSELPAAELSKYLERRGVVAKPDCIDAAGGRIGEILRSYLTSNQADLLVMGAYGHSRLREFILGRSHTQHALKAAAADSPFTLAKKHCGADGSSGTFR